MPRESTFCDHKSYSAAAEGLTRATTVGIDLATVLQTHQRTEVAATIRQKLAKPGPFEPNQVVRLPQKVEGEICYPIALLWYAHARREFVSLTCVLLDQQKWIDDHPEQPEGYLVFPSSKVSAFLSHILADCTASSSKDPHGAVKSARKALRHLRACQAGIPDDEAKFPSQPYIAGVTSRAKTATAEARQWLVAVCWQSTLAGHALEVS